MQISINFKLGKLKISVHYALFAALLITLLTNTIISYSLTLLSIFIHEAGHISTALLSGAAVHTVRFLPVGLNAEIDDAVCSRRRRLLIYSSGPFINFLLYFIFFVVNILFEQKSSFVQMAANINLYLGIFNLLPVHPLDGGKLAMELLASRLGVFRAGKRLHAFSVVLSIAIIILGVISFNMGRHNISLLIIGFYILMCIKGYREETAFMNIKNFIFRKTRIMRKGIYPAREIVVLKSVKLSEVIKAMDYIDRFHIVNVLDENLRVIKVMTEQEVLDAILGNTPDTTFDNLVQIEYNVHNEVN